MSYVALHAEWRARIGCCPRGASGADLCFVVSRWKVQEQALGGLGAATDIYTRKSTEEGLEQDFNSLDAQREACEAFIPSQKHEGWRRPADLYDDGGFSGGTMDRPALQRLLADIAAGKIDVVVVYKVDRLTRSLADFAKIVEVFDRVASRSSRSPSSSTPPPPWGG